MVELYDFVISIYATCVVRTKIVAAGDFTVKMFSWSSITNNAGWRGGEDKLKRKSKRKH